MQVSWLIVATAEPKGQSLANGEVIAIPLLGGSTRSLTRRADRIPIDFTFEPYLRDAYRYLSVRSLFIVRVDPQSTVDVRLPCPP